jgi:hypothetical protein
MSSEDFMFFSIQPKLIFFRYSIHCPAVFRLIGRQIRNRQSKAIDSINSVINTKLVITLVFIHHHQPINVPTAGAQAFLMDCNRTRGPSADWWVLTTANIVGTNSLTCLPKIGGARDNKFLVTHTITDQCCLASAIIRRAHCPRDHRSPP